MEIGDGVKFQVEKKLKQEIGYFKTSIKNPEKQTESLTLCTEEKCGLARRAKCLMECDCGSTKTAN